MYRQTDRETSRLTDVSLETMMVLQISKPLTFRRTRCRTQGNPAPGARHRTHTHTRRALALLAAPLA